MSDLYWLTDDQMERLRPFFPKSHGKPRVDDRRVLSGIVFVNRNGLRWRDAPKDYGPHKTSHNRWKRWGKAGVFARMMEGLAAADAEPKTVMIDATYLKEWPAPWKVALPEVGFEPLEDTRMGQKKHKPEEIVAKLRQVDVLLSQGRPVAEAIRTISVTPFTYYRWRKEFGGLKSDQVKRLKDLENENERLRKAVSDLTLEKLILKEAASGNW